jgi:2-polyprenyl-3-methyl-5-hydroxy-6-metoxy-1,4-benzoquinol methylase
MSSNSLGISLLQRKLEPERMDDPDLEAERHFEALRGIESINRWSGSLSIVWPSLVALAQQEPHRTLRVLDLATGAGDIPIGVCLRARQAGLRIHVSGCDRSPVAVTHARQRSKHAGVELDFFTLDALSEELPNDYDAIMCSLFLHHLETAEAERFLSRMGRSAGRMVLVSDLLRTHSGLFLAHYATRLLTRSPVVRADGPQSVRAAFTLDEVRTLASRAGLESFMVTRQRPCRFLLNWQRPAVRP